MGIGINLSAYVGPLPPPNVIADYEKIIPGAADRILKMAEEQSAHRRSIESKVVGGNSLDAKLGIAAGLVVAIGVLAVAAYCIYKGASLTGLAAVVVLIGSLVYSFRYAKMSADQALAEKRDANRLPVPQQQPPLTQNPPQP